ncbi:MAG: penicillin-binding transpeptidase domain-containing protein, partial [Sphingobacterium sp.]
KEWMTRLQKEFDKQWATRDAFTGANAKLLDRGMKRSDRYRVLKAGGASDADIKKDFDKEIPMELFTWQGNVDTVMTPMDSVRYMKLFLRNSMMAMEPHTGYIRAWVGGIDFEHFKYDQVKLGTRQVGSLAKPFVYAYAIDNGYGPCVPIPNHSRTYGRNWTPRGSVQGGDPITLKNAIKYSQNYATAYLINEVGAANVAEMNKRMGVNSNIPANLSIGLGSYDASLYDMVGAYSAFVNQGTWVEPIMILRVEDKNGTPIYEKAPKVLKALNSETAYAMVDMLKGVVDGGTGSRLRWDPNFGGLKNPIGGKTGTTNDNSDAWFIGVTPELVAGVWTGAEDRGVSFSSMRYGQGAAAAMPVFGLFMKKVFADKGLNYSQEDFAEPPGGITRFEMDCANFSQFYGNDPASNDSQPVEDDRLGF